MWTAVIRELAERFPQRKIVLDLEQKPSWWRFRARRALSRPEDAVIFRNNPRITRLSEIGRGEDPIRLYLDSEANSYFSFTSEEKVVFKPGGHIIRIILGNFGIEDPRLKCELFFSSGEKQRAERLTRDLPPFVVIEPNAKDDFTVNKSWPFECWQEVVDGLPEDVPVVQVGVAGGRVLRGVADLTGQTTFREAAAIVGRSRFLLSIEGGLVHAANAVGRPAVVVSGAWAPLEAMAYEENINLYSRLDCSPCGLRKPCPRGVECMTSITPQEVLEAAGEFLAIT